MAAVTSQATNSQDNPLSGFGPNEWIVEDMYQRYLADPASVDPAWHDFFADYRPMADDPATPKSATVTKVTPVPPAPPPAATAAPAPAAAPATPPPAPKPAPELDTFKFFLGKWKCDGKAFASPLSPTEHGVKGSAEAKLIVDNFWQSFTYEEKKTKEHPGLKVNGVWGFDQGSKRFVRTGAGNHGEWDTASAPGWEGDKLTWTGELSGPMGRVPFHHTFTKKSDKEWTHTLELRLPDGKWIPAEEITCKK